MQGGVGDHDAVTARYEASVPLAPAVRAVIVTAAGEESQVDYGTGPMVRDPLSGKYRRTRLFVMTLGYSRKSVRLLVFRSSARLVANRMSVRTRAEAVQAVVEQVRAAASQRPQASV